jgi:methyltransferase
VVLNDTLFWSFTGLLGLERLIEMIWAKRNERILRADGFEEMSGKHFSAIVLLHLLFFASLIIEYRSSEPTNLVLGFVIMFVLVQLLRFWVMLVIGSRFTTRILVKEGEQLVNRGPYRFLKHPLYIVVELEIVSLSLVVGAFWTALIFGIANALILLLVRIPAEERALARATGGRR